MLSAICLMLWSGCTTDLVPSEEMEAPFSVYGVLSPQLDTQSVLVYPIQQYLTEQRPSESESIRVTSTHLSSGTMRVWDDTVMTDSAGHHRFVFQSAFLVERGETYRIEAIRASDGATSYAEVRVPDDVEIEVVDPRPQGTEIEVRGEHIRVLKPVVQYVIQGPVPYPPLGYEIPYAGTEMETEGGWTVTVNLARDRERVQGWYAFDVRYPNTWCGTAYLNYFNLDILVGNRPWDPPGGFLDEDILQLQETMSNVQNGFGFVGAGYQTEKSLRLSRDLVEGACFLYRE